jgi:hypothetical protein
MDATVSFQLLPHVVLLTILSLMLMLCIDIALMQSSLLVPTLKSICWQGHFALVSSAYSDVYETNEFT